jgi:hypothetical protein
MQGTSAIGCISDTDPQPMLIRSRLGTYAITTVGIINNVDELIDNCLSHNGCYFDAMTGGRVNTTELVAAALSDLDIHSLQSAEKIDVAEFEREALVEKRGLIPQIEPRYHYTYFSHIFDGGYSAGYYFYIWAEVLDKDAYQAFEESGDIFDKATAERFRREVLSKGGTRAGMDMYRAFRGADPDKSAMLVARGLIEPEEEIEEEVRPDEMIVRVDTREMARQRAERSRREREAARLQAEADSLATADSLQNLEQKSQFEITPPRRGAEALSLGVDPIKK